MKGGTAKLHIDAAVQPWFCKARRVPVAPRTKVDKELEQLEKAEVIKPVQFSDCSHVKTGQFCSSVQGL